ncbi:MAG TPA: hypothetical protein VNH46_00490, partial [Gemmatimonadales bacterium]|nr:hypothetical protein [Gemmatimonadales bacterium]
MVTFLKNFRRSDAAAASPNGDAHTSAADLEQMQTMVANAMTAVEQLRSLAPVVESAAAMTALAERLQALEGQVTAMERLGGLLQQLEDQADRATKTQVRIDAQMNNTVKSVERAETQAATLSHQLDVVTTLRNELRSLVEEGGLENLRAEAGAVRGSIGELSEAVTRVRAQYDDMFRSQRHAASRIEAMDRQYQESAGRVADMEGRVEQATRILEQINQAVDGIPGVQHQLSVVKAVADQLSQRAATLEQQREAIDRASAQVSRFSELEKLIDGGLRRQEDQVRALAEVEGQLNEIQTFQATVVTRTEAIRNEQDELEAVAGMARGALAELREELTRSTEQVELEHRGLEAARERVADLRDALRQCEERLATLETSRQGLESVQAQAQELAAKLAGLADGLSRTTDQAIRLRSVGETAEQLDRRVQDVTGRLQRVEEVKDTVDAVVRDFRTLDGTHESIRDGLEQMRVAYEEMSRQRESLA